MQKYCWQMTILDPQETDTKGVMLRKIMLWEHQLKFKEIENSPYFLYLHEQTNGTHECAHINTFSFYIFLKSTNPSSAQCLWSVKLYSIKLCNARRPNIKPLLQDIKLYYTNTWMQYLFISINWQKHTMYNYEKMLIVLTNEALTSSNYFTEMYYQAIRANHHMFDFFDQIRI